MDDDGIIIIRAGATVRGGALVSALHWVDESGVERLTHMVRTDEQLLVREYEVVDGEPVKVHEVHVDRGLDEDDAEDFGDVLPFRPTRRGHLLPLPGGREAA